MTMDEKVSPTVSIVICAYNAAPFIADTLRSVIAQTFQDFEAIIVNDGSTDNTEAVIAPFLSEAQQLIYLKQENKGPAAARNTALRNARGRYIAILDSDDVWMPTYLETMVSLMQSNPSVDLYYPNAVFFGGTHLDGLIYQEFRPSSEPVTIEKFLKRECHVFISCLFKREILNAVGLFDEALRGSEDFDLWLRMLQHGYRFAFTREILVRYRAQPNSLSAGSAGFLQQVIAALRKFQSSSQATTEQRQLADDVIKDIEVDRDLLLSKQEIAAHDFEQARRHLLNVLRVRPSLKLKFIAVGLTLFPGLIARIMSKRDA